MSRMQKDHIDRASMQKSFTAKNRFKLQLSSHVLWKKVNDDDDEYDEMT